MNAVAIAGQYSVAGSPLLIFNTLTSTATYIATANLGYGSDPREKPDVY